MTRIRNILHSFRPRRARDISRADLVTFEAFSNATHLESSPKMKESCLGNHFDDVLSPGRHVEDHALKEKETSNNQTRPFLPHVVLLFLLFVMLLVIPLIYLLHCLGTVYDQQQVLHQPNRPVFELKPPATQIPPKVHLPPPPKPDYGQCRLLSEPERFDCFPQSQPNQQDCEARGCCWIPAKSKPKQQRLQSYQDPGDIPLNTPFCFYPPNFGTYNYINITDTASGIEAYLKRDFASVYPDDVPVIRLRAEFQTATTLRVKITDPRVNRYETPYPQVAQVDLKAEKLQYRLEIDATRPGFKVVRKEDGSVIFDTTTIRNFIYSNQFLQISSPLQTPYIYGIGEHRNNLPLSVNWTRYTLFNHDSIPGFNLNGYGSHPFYLAFEKSGLSHGVLLMNSNAMDVILQPTPAISFRPIGGVLDLFFFLGPTPGDVISQYTDVIERPFLPPYWGLGFHLCRFGYKTLNRTKFIMQRNIDAGIPLDTQWDDLDYMNNSNDFTYNHETFKGLPEFVRDLHARGMHYIPLIDPGVSGSEPAGTYPPYDLGLKMDIFVKNSTDQVFVGKVWNSKSTVWPDFTNPTSVDYWTHMIASMHNQFAFDGAWIDMNDPSNFLDGSVNGCPKNSLEHPPYVPAVDGGLLSHKTLCMSAKHMAGYHYDVHNLYGFAEAIVTHFALSEVRGKRAMVISRSTFPGHGHFAGHWSGDVVSTWLDMRYSIPQLLSFSLFGIPLMGADICGFNGNTTKELCNRWMQLGAFYPFSRNHNTDDAIDQDPAAFGPDVIAASKKALLIRYSLLPYLYTLFFNAHTKGETVARPLFFEFPKDVATYTIDTQFLWGPALMIVPVLEENAITVNNVYLPNGIWYDFYTKQATVSNSGIRVNLSAPLDTIPLLIRGGYIMPQQKPEQTTTKSRLNQLELLAAADEDGTAEGEIYWDDGDSLNSYEEEKYSFITFSMEKGVLRINVAFLGYDAPPHLGTVTILGIKDSVEQVHVNDVSQPFKYDTINKYLIIENLNVSLILDNVITWK